MSPVLSVSNGFLPPAFTMHRCDMWSMNPKKVSKLVDNKRLPLLTTKAKSTSSSLGTKKMEEKDEKLKNKDFREFTGALPPCSDFHFIPPVYDCCPLSAYKILAEELEASTTFAEAAYIYPSSTETLDAAFTYARNFQSFANGKIHMQPTTIEYISLSNNIPKTSPPFEDIGEVEKRILEGKVGVVFVEPIHGNDGLKSFPPEHLRSLRTLCDKAGTLLAFDEVQCGLGQTGWLWVHQAVGVKPDLMMVQFRGIGIGALVVNKRLNGYKHKYESNEHMMRECGNALKIFRNVRQRGYSAIVKRKGRYFEEIMTKQLYGVSNVGPIRAFGLLVAMELCIDAQSFVDKCKENGLGFVYAGKGNMVRILPPFNVNAHELDHAVAIMKECLRCPDDWVRPADYYPYYL